MMFRTSKIKTHFLSRCPWIEERMRRTIWSAGVLIEILLLLVAWTDLVCCRGNGGRSGSRKVSNPKHYDFDEMSELLRRLDVLESAGPEMLMGFFDPQLQSFSIRPGSPGEATANLRRVCITSTCYALHTLTLGSSTSSATSSTHNGKTFVSGAYESVLSHEKRGFTISDHIKDDACLLPPSNKISIPLVLSTLLTSDEAVREEDLFQVPLLLCTLLRTDTDRSLIKSAIQARPEIADKIRCLIQAVFRGRPQHGIQQPHSEYVNYQICKVVAMLQESTSSPTATYRMNSTREDEHRADGAGGLPLSAVPEEVASDMFWVLLRSAEVSSNTLCRQLAYRCAGDYNRFDVIRLAYALLSYVRSTRSLSGIAGRELVPGQGPSPETKVAPLNQRLVTAALSAFFEEQNKDGLWDKGQPIYKSFQGSDRNMGNAFVFPVNTVGSLLCMLPAEAFRPHLRALEKTLDWIESHQGLEIITNFTDISGQCYGRPLGGWSSPHLSSDVTGPQAWPTAQVLKCVFWMRNTIRELMHNDVLEEFKGVAYSKKGMQTESWDRLLDSDLGMCDETNICRTIKSVLEERVVKPFEKSIENPSYGAAYSAILHGPPGTAKTTICESLAQRMGYDFCVIDTAAFLADGLSNVSARIRYVFSRLMALSKCVILFDEIEEFALDRETPGLSMESRMLTTAMLTAINDLRRKQNSVFFVATNRLRAFDSAITRPGRFDLQLFVGTPNLEARTTQLEQKLGGLVDETTKENTVKVYRAFLESVWSQDAMFMNYLEGLQFASACADIVISNGRLTNKEMAAILKTQAAVMTVRGPTRDEYLASMELSRL